MDYQKITIEANGEEAELDCYLWSESPEYANGRKRPCVLILPGGGYSFVADREVPVSGGRLPGGGAALQRAAGQVPYGSYAGGQGHGSVERTCEGMEY